MKKMIRNILVVIIFCAITKDAVSLVPRRSQRSADTCGLANSDSGLIVRGETFSRGTLPWIVAFKHTGFDPPRFFCGGTLISATFVVSAAHCFLQKHAAKALLPREVLAHFGVHDLTLQEPKSIRLSPKKIFIHDDWNQWRTSYDADISLLEFDEGEIHFSYYVQPICLWPSQYTPPVIDGTITGWGKSEDPANAHENTPRLIKVRLQTNEKCFLDTKGLVDLSSSRTFCAGLRNGSGVCTGDSGGGLSVTIDNVYYLRGIVSSSLVLDNKCDVSKDAIYTNVLIFSDWLSLITRATREVFCSFKNQKSYFFERRLPACTINQPIGSDAYVLASPTNASIIFFDLGGNRQVKYLPSKVGEKFSNLKEYGAMQCGLTILRDFYFKDMGKVQHVDLSFNFITTIEKGAFDDLVSMEKLSMHFNMIETLDEKVFSKLTNLKKLYIDKNKLRFLSPTTFITPGKSPLVVHDWEADASKFARSFNGLLEKYLMPGITEAGLSDLIGRFEGF